MNQAFREKIDRMEDLLDELQRSDARDWDDRKGLPKEAVYVFYENGCPIYAGRSRDLQRRIYEHGARSSRSESATLAFILLRRKIGQPGGHASPFTRKQIQDDHSHEFAEQRKRIRGMQFRFVEVEDDEEQVLFELYASIALPTKYNSFRTT